LRAPRSALVPGVGDIGAGDRIEDVPSGDLPAAGYGLGLGELMHPGIRVRSGVGWDLVVKAVEANTDLPWVEPPEGMEVR
jgi:hypothetical protein